MLVGSGSGIVLVMLQQRLDINYKIVEASYP